jgi:hypothetical protein
VVQGATQGSELIVGTGSEILHNTTNNAIGILA